MADARVDPQRQQVDDGNEDDGDDEDRDSAYDEGGYPEDGENPWKLRLPHKLPRYEQSAAWRQRPAEPRAAGRRRAPDAAGGERGLAGIEHQWRSGLGVTADGAPVYAAGPALDPL